MILETAIIKVASPPASARCATGGCSSGGAVLLHFQFRFRFQSYSHFHFHFRFHLCSNSSNRVLAAKAKAQAREQSAIGAGKIASLAVQCGTLRARCLRLRRAQKGALCKHRNFSSSNSRRVQRVAVVGHSQICAFVCSSLNKEHFNVSVCLYDCQCH